MKLTYQWFCNSIIWRARDTGRISDDVLIEAVRDAFMLYEQYSGDEEREKKLALRKANRLLRRQDIKDRLARIFALRGFSIVDATDKLIEHIQGIELVLRNRDGEIVYGEDGQPKIIRGDPSLQALLAYFKMVMGAPTQKVDMTVRRGTDYVAPSPELAAMNPRVLSAKVEE